VVGNEKVPTVTKPDADTAEIRQLIQDLQARQDTAFKAFQALEPTINEYEAAASITLEQWETLNTALNTIKAEFNAARKDLSSRLNTAVDNLPPGNVKNKWIRAWNATVDAFKALKDYVTIMVDRVKNLAKKIV
jgi:chromosome segregation ATPase